MYGSDHASHEQDHSEAKDQDDKALIEADGTLDSKNEVKSMGKRKKSVKSRSSLKNRDEISVSGVGTNVNGKNKNGKMKWNSTKH